MIITLAQNSPGNSIAIAIGGLVFGLIYLSIIVLLIVGAWKMFVKAGQPGWGVLIPFFNLYLVLKICGRPGWWLILFFVPILNIAFSCIVSLDLAKSFGKGIGFGIGLFFLNFIFIPILGFGSAEYEGPAGAY
ncbi:MAG: DUF5684 domain-containing protein [Phycisphaerales bacterium]|nr:DUF5684 domain-containing protein [Phycisphaerales bacterium]